MKPKPFEIIVEFIPQSTKTGITYKAHQNGSLIRCKDCKWYAHCDDCYGDCMKEGAVNGFVYTNDYCSRAEPKEKE